MPTRHLALLVHVLFSPPSFQRDNKEKSIIRKHRLPPDGATTKQTIRALVLQATAGTHTHLQHIIHITSHLPPHAYVHHSHPEDLFQPTNECCLTRSRLALQALNLPRQPFRLLLHTSTLRSCLEMSRVHATFNPWLLCSACADVVLHTILCPVAVRNLLLFSVYASYTQLSPP